MPKSQEKEIVKGMKVKEKSSGRIAKITVVDNEADQVWMVSGSEMGVFKKSVFWEFFEEVTS